MRAVAANPVAACSVLSPISIFTLRPIGKRSIVTSVSVCLSLCVCLSVHDHIFGTMLRPIFTKFFMPVTLARPASGGVVIRYILPVLRMTSYLLISRGSSRRRHPAEAQRTRSLGLGYKLCAVIPVAGQRTHRTTFLALKVTSQVATPGAESAVYECLVWGMQVSVVVVDGVTMQERRSRITADGVGVRQAGTAAAAGTD